VLVLAVDPEQLRVLSTDPQDKRLAADLDLEVVVRDPAAERLDDGAGTGPDPLDERVDH
jgi:hypothetical protein